MTDEKFVIQSTRENCEWYDFSIQPTLYIAEHLIARYRKNRPSAEYRLVHRIISDVILEETS